jgi:hypothetical protein
MLRAQHGHTMAHNANDTGSTVPRHLLYPMSQCTHTGPIARANANGDTSGRMRSSVIPGQEKKRPVYCVRIRYYHTSVQCTTVPVTATSVRRDPFRKQPQL